MAVVYQITNLVNGHSYIGVTKHTSKKRWKQHVYAAGRREYTSLLHSAIRKHGAENFFVADVASCLSDPGRVEQLVIKSFAPEYNITCGGEFTVGRRKPHSQETRAKIRAANIGRKRSSEARANISTGKKKMMLARPEVKSAMIARILAGGKTIDREKQRAAAAKASKGRIWSEESRKKLSASMMGRRYAADVVERRARAKDKPVECIELATVFDSVSEAAFFTGVSISGVSAVCLEKRNRVYGLHFNFI